MSISSEARIAQPIRNAITVDVEDYFQVQAYADVIPRTSWDAIPRRVEANTDRMLAAFASRGVKGTFFTLGWVAERHPALIRRIVEAGHELASHGYGHELVTSMTAADFRADVGRARRLLEDIGGVAVTGYRAPTFPLDHAIRRPGRSLKKRGISIVPAFSGPARSLRSAGMRRVGPTTLMAAGFGKSR